MSEYDPSADLKTIAGGGLRHVDGVLEAALRIIIYQQRVLTELSEWSRRASHESRYKRASEKKSDRP